MSFPQYTDLQLNTDRFATQPLAYRVVDGRLFNDTRADALAGAGAALDPQALFDYLYFHVIPSPRTVFQGVRRVPPGYTLRFQDGQPVLEAHWTPRFAPRRDAASFPALKHEFLQLLRNAVGARLDGGKPGCFLSGGTDSSTVAGMIGLAAGRPAATYSIGFDAEGYDEMAFARIAARHFGTEHHEYYVTPDDLVAGIPEVAASYDQPFGNSSAVPAYYCALMAKRDGVTRVLAGDGGDELFGGNKRYATQRVFGIYDALPGWTQRGLRAVFDNGPMSRVPLFNKGTSYIRQGSVPLPDRLQTYNLLERLGVERVLTPSFLSQVDRDDPQRQQRKVWAEALDASPLNRQLAFDWRYTLAENDLPKVVGTARLAGIEVGFPLLDERLVDFSLQLPVHYKLRGLRLRWFFKEALRGFLPEAIISKKKQGFGLPFGVWAVQHKGLRALASGALGSLGTRGMVRPEFIRELLDHHLPSHPHFYGEMVWILLMLEHWLQRHAPGFRTA